MTTHPNITAINKLADDILVFPNFYWWDYKRCACAVALGPERSWELSGDYILNKGDGAEVATAELLGVPTQQFKDAVYGHYDMTAPAISTRIRALATPTPLQSEK